MRLPRIDHVVLTVADMEATIAFYTCALGMRHVVIGDRHALHFGDSKINLHPEINDYPPLKAALPTIEADTLYVSTSNDALVAPAGTVTMIPSRSCENARELWVTKTPAAGLQGRV